MQESIQEQAGPSFFERMKQKLGLAPTPYDYATPDPYLPEKFEANDPKLAEYFDTHGYVVIKNAATPEDLQKGLSLFWDLVEQQQPLIKRGDPSTWNTDHWIASPENGIMWAYGIGQSQFAWHARTLPKVKEAFTLVWKTDDLLVSYDGCGVFRPIEYDMKWKTKGGWYHIDQNVYNKKGKHAVQGLLNFLPSGPNDGGFVVVPKSVHMIDEAFEKYGDLCSKKARDYMRTYPDESFWMEAIKNMKRGVDTKYDLLPVKLVLEAGDFVMWDSRTIHCNGPPTKPSNNPDAKNNLKRLACYVCMTPSSMAKDIESLAKYRVHAFQYGITTTHWPHEFQPSWVARDKLVGVGASYVKLTPEQAKLITGNKSDIDVYDEKVGASVNIDNIPTND